MDAEQLRILANQALAEKNFASISDSEWKLLQAFIRGEDADYRSADRRSADRRLNDPANASTWNEDRTLRAFFIRWLCTDSEACKCLTHSGLKVLGAKIEGDLDLRYAHFDAPLIFQHCAFLGLIQLEGAKIKLLDLSGSHVISNHSNISIHAHNIKVENDVLLKDGFNSRGRVLLSNATIGGNLDCAEGSFGSSKILSTPEQRTILAQGAEIKGSVMLSNDFISFGCVSLAEASIGGQLECNEGVFYNPKGDAVLANNVEIKGPVRMCGQKFIAVGRVAFKNAIIGGDLECSEGSFFALKNMHCTILYNIVFCLIDKYNALKKCAVKEEMFPQWVVFFMLHNICIFVRKEDLRNDSLTIQSSEIKGSVILNENFNSTGILSISGATIGGVLECSKGKFLNPGGYAFEAQNTKFKSSVFFGEGFEANGIVHLQSAIIDDVFSLRAGINLCSNKMVLDLQMARIGSLDDREESWPKAGNLCLDGFVYTKITKDSPLKANQRLQWLRLQDSDDLNTQSYEQLAQVLRVSGYQSEAKKILMAKQKYYLRRITKKIFKKLNEWDSKSKTLPKTLEFLFSLENGFLRICWNWFWDKTMGLSTGHGYYPLRSIYWSILFVIVGTFIFGFCNPEGTYNSISPSRLSQFDSSFSQTVIKYNNAKKMPADYPVFNPFIYSLDVFLPVVDFHQESYWLPDANKTKKIQMAKSELSVPTGQWLRFYFWCHIALGWFLTTLGVAGFTGLVRRIE